MITPAALSNLAWKAYLIFMCTNLAFIPLVYFCYPETSNLTLEEVDNLFSSDATKGSWKTGFKGLHDFAKQGGDGSIGTMNGSGGGLRGGGLKDEEDGSGSGAIGKGELIVDRHEGGDEKGL